MPRRRLHFASRLNSGVRPLHDPIHLLKENALDIIEAIKAAIERALGNGDWTGAPADGGRLEGNLDSVDVEEVEVTECDLESGSINVRATGLGSISYPPVNGEDGGDITEEPEVVLDVTISIDVTPLKDEPECFKICLGAKIDNVKIKE